MNDDIKSELNVGFILDFGGKNVDNEIFKSFRYSWENQNVEVHLLALSIVMGALIDFKTKLLYNTESYLRVADKSNMSLNQLMGVPNSSYETHLVGFDILSNKDFDGLQSFKEKSSVNPKYYSCSPLVVRLKMFNINYEIYSMINRIGHFFIKGEGDINYVNDFDTSTMNNVNYSHITAFKVNQLCFYNLNTDTEQVLFG